MELEMTCYRRILHLSWIQKAPNRNITEWLNIKEDLVQVVMKRKLNLLGHINRMNNIRKLRSVIMGVMEGNQRRGRPCREWFDDTRLVNGRN